ncbi:MAG TPA: Nudix family hydrolase [Burkholderiales bacterium]|jgi:8-oxo-dGTP diphosphatase|nr:Nudix family hydrolase [Burkholderiales bacterium]
MLEVAVAVIERADGAFLLAQRPAGKVYAGWWEFPGGKVHDAESAQAALARELHEELGIDVGPVFPWITRVFVYPHATVRLNFFRVVKWSGEPHPREEQAIRWQRFDAPMAEPMLPANAPVLRSLALPLEYAVTCAETLGTEEMLMRVERRLQHGLRMIQVRDKTLHDRTGFARAVVALAHRYDAKVLVNGDEEEARAIGADGVHWTAAVLGRAQKRPAGLLCGASCHTAAELERAAALECDFAVLGPVRDTTTHAASPPLGWDGFERLARGAPIPVFAIGGLRLSDLDESRRCGAHGLAMIRGSWA